MGEANQRGTPEERREQAMERMLDSAEVLIALSADEQGVSMQVLPRDEQPDQDSPAVILAGFINANLGNLMQTAFAAKEQHEQNQGAGQQNPQFIKTPGVRSITTPEGGLAKAGPKLLGPDGKLLLQ